MTMGQRLAVNPTDTLKRAIFDAFSAETLAELAYLRRQQESSVRARQQLSPDKLTELAEMVAAGGRPSLGWWSRATGTGHPRRAQDLIAFGRKKGAAAILRRLPQSGAA
jgi:hypothetical protein